MNQINYHQIDETEKRQIELEFNTKQQILMCPFAIVDGVDSISQGAYIDDPEKFKSASFENVFQGRNPVIVVWRNSTKSINEKTPGGLPDFNKPAKKDFKVGTHWPVILNTDGETYFNSFNDDEQGNKRFTTSSQISIKFKGEFQRLYWYDWMLFPELGEEFYYPETINFYRDKDESFSYTEITFKKVNDELELVTTNAKTLILRSSPGEEYAWPFIQNPTDKKQLWNNLVLDLNKQIPQGVKYIQLSSLEPMLLGSFYAMGRRINKNNEDSYIEESRHLLPASLVPAVPDPILGINAPSDKFYWLEQGQISMGKEYQNWITKFKENAISFFTGNLQNEAVKNYGAIKIEDIDTAVKSAPNIKKDDAAGNAIEVPQTYWDDWKIEAKSEIIYDSKSGYKTFTPFATERLNNLTELAHNKLAKNAFILASIISLPIEYESKVPFGIVNMIVGGLSKIILGYDPKKLSNNNNRTNKVDLALMGEHSYIDFIRLGLMDGDAGEGDSKKYMPLQLFSGDRPEILTGKNVNTFNIKIELSDLINIDGNNIIKSDLLGKKDINYFNDNSKVESSPGNSYILDRIIIQGISLGNIKLTLFNNLDQPISAFVLNTNAKKTGSILDWTTVIKTSMWESDETKEITPQIPGPTYISPNEILLDNLDIINWIKIPSKATPAIEGGEVLNFNKIDIYEEVKKQDPNFKLTKEEFLETYALKCNYDFIVKDTLKTIYQNKTNSEFKEFTANRIAKPTLTTHSKPISSLENNALIAGNNTNYKWFAAYDSNHYKINPRGYIKFNYSLKLTSDGCLNGSLTTGINRIDWVDNDSFDKFIKGELVVDSLYNLTPIIFDILYKANSNDPNTIVGYSRPSLFEMMTIPGYYVKQEAVVKVSIILTKLS